TSTINVMIQQELTEKLSAELLLGNDIFDRKFNEVSADGNDFVTPNFYDLSNVRDVSVDQSKSRRRLIGVYGDLMLNYDDFLYLDITARNDWSSTLPVNNRSFF